MEHLEGRQSILAALQARQRRFEVILTAHGMHTEKIQEVLKLASALGVPTKSVERRELDALAHGRTHGGLLAVATGKPRLSGDELLKLLDTVTGSPLLLLLEGI